jgi:hypothetical protein
VRALITPGHLVRATRLREDTHVDVLDVSSRDTDGNDILGLASRGARVTSDAAGMVDDLGPLLWLFVACLRFNHWVFGSGEYSTISTSNTSKSTVYSPKTLSLSAPCTLQPQSY